MKPTQQFIEQKFDEFNQLCFDGKLTRPPMKISHGKTMLGRVVYTILTRPDGSRVKRDFYICISDYGELSQEEREDIILHEMIHYYIDSNQLQDNAPHGLLFRRLMQAINERFGRHIDIRRHAPIPGGEASERKIRHALAVLDYGQGERGFAVVAKSRLPSLWERMIRLPDVMGCTWYYTDDPFFHRYVSRSGIKVYQLTDETARKHLAGARRLLRKYGRFLIV